MSTVSGGIRNRLGGELAFDRGALGLVMLFLLVHLATVALVVHYQAIEFAAEGPPGVDGSSASTGAAFAIVEVAFAATLLGVIIVWRYLPEWFQKLIIWNAVIAMLMLHGAVAFGAEIFWEWTAIMMAGFTFLRAATHFGVWWIFNDILALLLGIAVAASAATWFGPSAIIVAIIGLTVYDYWFADRKTWMFSLAEAMLKIYLPLVVVKPKRLRTDWGDIVEAMTSERDENDDTEPTVGWAIGTADLLLPALFAGAIAYTGDVLAGGQTTWAVMGVIFGTLLACFRIRHKMLTEGGGAGLPPLAAGTIGGYVVALVPWVMLA